MSSAPSTNTVRDLFLAALDEPPETRSAWLERACAGDEVLRRQVEDLLQRHDEPDSLLDQTRIDLGRGLLTPCGDAPSACDLSLVEPAGTIIGRYELLEPIGQGGMGIVYRARQHEPIRRDVALKVIKPGMDSQAVIARFQAERQALALMDHPHITKVLDAGATEAGRPYFVVELVHGVPITTYCETCALTLRERLELFVPVCQALQHAHQRGIIHRDIKPSNVLIERRNDQPSPRIIDFGVAKAIGPQALTDQALTTGFAQLIGTPLYMSPEQAELSPLGVDARSDVYSLGVLLYELLTGTTPFEAERLRTASFDELRRIIQEEEPPRPSARISTLGDEAVTIAENRRTEPRRLAKRLRWDLDWIVLKALEKDPHRRYQSAAELADDVQRFLASQPITARPPGVTQTLVKWTRRHAGLVTAGALLLLVTTLALIVSTLLISREQSQTAAALTQARDNFTEAQRQKQEAQRQKTEAERHALEARRAAYVTDMRLAFQQWKRLYLAEVQSLLDDQIPQPGEADLRGLEWYALRTQIGRRFYTLGRHDGPVHDIDLFPDGHTLATAGEDGYVRVWDADSRSLLREFHLQDKPVYTVGVSPDGKWLAYGAGRRDELDVPKPATIIDAQTGTVLGTTNWHKNTIRQVRFSPDGRYLVSSSLQDKVSVWEFTDGVHGRSRDLTGEQDIPSEYFTLLFLDSHRLLTEYHNRTGYRVWDLETGEPLQDYPDLNEVNVHAVAWHPRHHVFAYVPSKDYGQTIQFRDGTTGRELGEYSLNEEVTALTFSPYTDSLSAGTARGCLRIMDLAFPPRSPGSDEPVQVKYTTLWQIHEGEIKRVRYLDRYRVITAGVDGRVVLRYAPRTYDPSPFVQSKGTQFAAAPREGVIAWAGVDGAVRLADHQTGELLATTHPLPGGPQALAWSADGSHLAAICGSGAFGCWRVEGHQLVECLRDSVTDMQDGGAGLALSRDGSRLYVSGDRGPDGIHVWDVTTGLKAGFVPTLYTVHRLLVSPDNRLLIGAHEGLFVFDRETLEQRHYLQIGGIARALLFAPDGRTLIAGYDDGAIRLWDPEEGRLLRELVEYDRDDAVTSALLLSPDGQTLIAGDHKGRLRFWNTATWGCLGSLTLRSTRAITVGTAWIHSLAVTPAGDGLDLTTGGVDVPHRYFERLPLQDIQQNTDVEEAAARPGS